MKTCSSCNQEKPPENFYHNKRAKDGRDWTCVECVRIKSIKYRAKVKTGNKRGELHEPWTDEEKKSLIALTKEYKTRTEISKILGRTIGAISQQLFKLGHTMIRRDLPYLWKCMALGAARQRAKNNNLSFDITHIDVPEPTYCPILGIKLDYERRPGVGQKNRHDGSAELDRIIPEKGYVKGNIDVISRKANGSKCDATEDFCRKLLAYFESHKVS